MQEVKAQPAALTGQAGRIPAAMKAKPAILHATIEVKRADTGKVETYTITGTPVDESKEP
jgi:hypothetical protein